MKRLFTMMLGLCLLAMPSLAGAEEIQNTSTEPAPSVSTQLKFNEYQKDDTSAYFNMDVEGGETLTASLVFTNTGDIDATVSITPTNAITGCYGNINYTPETEVANAWIDDEDYGMVQYVTIEESVVVPVGETVEVPFTVEVPEDGTGTVLGGFRIFVEGTESTSESDSVAITTKSEQVYGLQLNYTEKEEVSVNSEYAYVEGNTVYVHINNENNTITEDVSFSVTVKDKTGTEMFSYDVQPFKMAPNSTIEYPVAFDGDLENGKYVVEVTINSPEGSETFSHDVEVNRESTTTSTNGDESQGKPTVADTDDRRWLLLLLLIIATGTAVYYRRKKKQEQRVSELLAKELAEQELKRKEATVVEDSSKE